MTASSFFSSVSFFFFFLALVFAIAAVKNVAPVARKWMHLERPQLAKQAALARGRAKGGWRAGNIAPNAVKLK